jgi:Uma2 family endonuclease
MTTTADILEQIFKRPDAPSIVLQAQERLRAEKLRRKAFYNDITPSIKAEFIEGEVVVHSPVRKMHNSANGKLYKIIDSYSDMHDLGFVGIEKILVQCSRNDYEPDLCFFGNEKAQHFTEDQMFFPAPDFVVEVVSKSTERADRKIKFVDYALHGVTEYWIIAPMKQVVEQYKLTDSVYQLVKKHTITDTIECIVLENLHIPVLAIFEKQANIAMVAQIFAAK